MSSANPADGFGPLLLLVMLLLIASIILRSGLSTRLKALIIAALAARVVGAFAYYGVFETLYGTGDYKWYHQVGSEYAARMARGDFQMFVESGEWHANHWWGTQFVLFPAGLVSLVVGNNVIAGFVAFSLLAFVGLAALAIAFHRSFPNVPLGQYALWIWLFPSLWFWSSTIGKDSLLLCGLGVAVLGYVGKFGRVQWTPLCCGLMMVFAVRPQVAAVVIFAMVIGQWAGTVKRWTVANTIQSIALLVAGLASISMSLSTAGAGSIDPEAIGEYMDDRAEIAAQGGSSVQATGTTWSSAPLAVANVLFRPLPVEAQTATALVASLELSSLWAIAFLKRRNILAALKGWRSHRLLVFSIVFILAYSAALGMMVVNLGIIARQRIVLFPFLLLLFEAIPVASAAEPRRRAFNRGGRGTSALLSPMKG